VITLRPQLGFPRRHRDPARVLQGGGEPFRASDCNKRPVRGQSTIRARRRQAEGKHWIVQNFRATAEVDQGVRGCRVVRSRAESRSLPRAAGPKARTTGSTLREREQKEGRLAGEPET